MPKPRISSFVSSVVVGFAFFVGLPEAGSAQLTCGWCAEWESIPGYGLGPFHAFATEGGDQCGWPKPTASDGGQVTCNRCGGDSRCHIVIERGPCHILCGPAGDLAEAAREVQKGFDDGDLTLVARAILRERGDVSVEYIPRAGRINFVLPCDPTRIVHTIAVLPAVRRALNARIAGRIAAAAR